MLDYNKVNGGIKKFEYTTYKQYISRTLATALIYTSMEKIATKYVIKLYTDNFKMVY